MDNIISGEFKRTGINTINIDEVIKKWNHLWWLSEWRIDNSFRLIKNVRKDSPMTACKLTISYEQAHELIGKLKLLPTNTGFASGFSWRREEDAKELLDNINQGAKAALCECSGDCQIIPCPAGENCKHENNYFDDDSDMQSAIDISKRWGDAT
jgi:hypothetical protein